MYTTILDFTDAVDGGVYRAGDPYPRPGVEPSADRVAFLLSAGTRHGAPVIAPAEAPAPKKKERKPKP